MPSSHRRKRRLKVYRIFRAKNNIRNCFNCKKSIKDVLHHAYCNECWIDRKNNGLSTAPRQ